MKNAEAHQLGGPQSFVLYPCVRENPDIPDRACSLLPGIPEEECSGVFTMESAHRCTYRESFSGSECDGFNRSNDAVGELWNSGAGQTQSPPAVSAQGTLAEGCRPRPP